MGQVTQEERVIELPDHRIYGKLYRPKEQERKLPLVIVSHGFNGIGDDFEQLAVFLAGHGIAAYCYDFCAGSVRTRSSGTTRQMTISLEVSNLLEVYEAACTWEEIDPDHIYLFGESQGGLVTALIIEKLQDKIRGAILQYPALCIFDDWTKNYPDPELAPEAIELWEVTLSAQFVKDVHGRKVFDEIGTYKGPVLIMHGTDDPIVPIAYSEQAAETYPNAELVVFRHAGHGFGEEDQKRRNELVITFIKEGENE